MSAARRAESVQRQRRGDSGWSKAARLDKQALEAIEKGGRPMETSGPTRGELLGEMAARGMLPRHVELDYYRAEEDEYTQFVRLLQHRGWLNGVEVVRQNYMSGVCEQFTVAGVTITSPREVTPLLDRPAPIEKLAESSTGVLLEIDGVRVSIVDPRAAAAIRDAVEAVVEGAIRDDAGRPLPSRRSSSDKNVIALPLRGRGLQVASDREGA